jgi:hypothetical protein
VLAAKNIILGINIILIRKFYIRFFLLFEISRYIFQKIGGKKIGTSTSRMMKTMMHLILFLVVLVLNHQVFAQNPITSLPPLEAILSSTAGGGASEESSSSTSSPTSSSKTTSTTTPSRSLPQWKPDEFNRTDFKYGHYCTCDITKTACDVNCCCDVDCTDKELRAFYGCKKVIPHNLNHR